MRGRVRQSWLRDRTWLFIVAGGGLGAALIVSAFAAYSTAFQTPSQPPSSTIAGEPPPQAAASAPQPTLVAVAGEQPALVGSPDASPFAGIAEAPAQQPRRTSPTHHTVGPGEVLWQIAEQYTLRPETLVWANDIRDADLLLVGQDLLIPPADGVEYTVRPGDRLADVANRYGVDLPSIVSSNGLGDADQIQAGVDIFLPGGRPIATIDTSGEIAAAAGADDQATAARGLAVPLPDNIDALLGAGWLRALRVTDLYKTADASSSKLHQLPGSARLERLDGFRTGRIQVRDPGDGRTRQAMTGWVDAVDLDLGRAPATRELPQAYPVDTAMDIAHVFAPYRSQLDGSPYAEANCGPTAVGMALDAFGISVPSRQLRAGALSAQHMSGNGVGTLITALAQVVEQNGLSAMDLRNDDGGLRKWGLDDIRAQIQQGHPVVVQVRYRSLPGRGGTYYFGDHYILVTGVTGDGFLYNDPIDFDGVGWDRVISSASLRVAMNASDGRYAYTAFGVGR